MQFGLVYFGSAFFYSWRNDFQSINSNDFACDISPSYARMFRQFPFNRHLFCYNSTVLTIMSTNCMNIKLLIELLNSYMCSFVSIVEGIFFGSSRGFCLSNQFVGEIFFMSVQVCRHLVTQFYSLIILAFFFVEVFRFYFHKISIIH